jgi:hypothetical protein
MAPAGGRHCGRRGLAAADGPLRAGRPPRPVAADRPRGAAPKDPPGPVCRRTRRRCGSVRPPPYSHEHMFLAASNRLHSWLQAVDRAVDEMLAGDEAEPADFGAPMTEPFLEPDPAAGSFEAEPVLPPAGPVALEPRRHPHRRTIARRPRVRRAGVVRPAAMPCLSPVPAAQPCLSPPKAAPGCPHADTRTRE